MRAPAFAMAVLLTACSSPLVVPPTEVLVTVDATSAVRVRATSLTVQVSSSTSRTGPYTNAMSVGFGPPAAQVGFPRRLALVPAMHDATRFFEVQATAFALDGATMTMTPVATTLVRSGYLPHRLLQLTIFLDDTPCPATCPVDQTCRHGVCSAIFVDPGVLHDADAGTDAAARDDGGDAGGSDAGPGDAGPSDAGVGDGGGSDAGCHRDTECSDGNACNGKEKCIEGTCQPDVPLVCDDLVACTTDTCAPASGCVYTPNDGLCTAGAGGHCDVTTGCQYTSCDAVTCRPDGPTCMSATCMAGVCVRSSACTASQQCCGGTCIAACDDGNVCTDDSCNATAHACVHANNMAFCSDGDACTSPDKCSGGHCGAGGTTFCTDGNDCTIDTCVSPTGCRFSPVTSAPGTCDDHSACTTDDHCESGTCVGTGMGGCNDNNPCTSDACNGAGGCVFSPVASGSDCVDPANCIFGGATCVSGVCQPAIPPCGSGLLCCSSLGYCVTPGATDCL